MIEVGEYVRFDDGDILKICGKLEKSYVMEPSEGNNFTLPKIAVHKDMVKHSKNIIDLIEVGDIVTEIKVRQPERIEVIKINNIEMLDRFRNGDIIYSIVTKEQFASMEYRCGGLI